MSTWAIAPGTLVTRAELTAADLVVLDPYGEISPQSIRRPGQTVIAWLSLGTVDESRPFYRLATMAPGAVAGSVPGRPGFSRLDPRSTAWRTLVIGQIAPAILKAGYDGLYLDDLDVGPALEAAGGHDGAGAATAELIADIRGLEPELRLIAHGGLALLPAIAKALDAVATDSVYTEQLAAAPWVRMRPEADAKVLVEALSAARKATGLPILVAERLSGAQAGERAGLTKRIRDAGFVPFIAPTR